MFNPHLLSPSGRISKLTLWNYVQPNTYGAVAAGARMAAAARKLLGVQPYHFHTKIMLKEPSTGGAWMVHQDFGYWYRTGTLHPDQMMSCILAVDEASLENGCLEVRRTWCVCVCGSCGMMRVVWVAGGGLYGVL